MHYGDRLAEERNRLGLSQNEMAQKGGVSARTYAYYESGEREPGVGSLNAWHAIGADVLYIVNGEHSANSLTPDEQALLTAYRALDARGKVAAVGSVMGLSQPQPTSGTSIHIGGQVGNYITGNQTGPVSIDMSKGRKKRS
ncbi:helix-turn-helix transcriptional regulator [Ralstonia solanacearum]|nr:helix-turn-helix transcriptional regulator [Ralstonia solanacearum]QNT62939.1 helix-turn-helix transcriptional regulator [Ralstonia solanacearum]